MLRSPKVCYKKAGISDADIHSLRHTFCTQLARRNVPAQKIMMLAGHHDIETAPVYVVMVREDLMDSVERLDFCSRFSDLRQNYGSEVRR
ncbi:MAG: tyrosine-type recombinase/integrase [Deltaproteobacteria bacterium]|nr:tyrosine-type recombinase/integrase [Deltaproteobacteria bacterium]